MNIFYFFYRRKTKFCEIITKKDKKSLSNMRGHNEY